LKKKTSRESLKPKIGYNLFLEKRIHEKKKIIFSINTSGKKENNILKKYF
jgi:hypothetical protein